MEVRQAVAGIRRAHLFDELDHLGAYLKKNRFDHDITGQLKGDKLDMVIWDGMSDIIDRSFEGEAWESNPFPTQQFPVEVLKLLEALDATRARGWLSADSYIRDRGEEARKDLAKMLSDLRQTLNQYPSRYFVLSGEGEALFVWLQRYDAQIDWAKVNDKASAAALAVGASSAIGVLAAIGADGGYRGAQFFAVQIPAARTDENIHVYEDAARIAQRGRVAKPNERGRAFRITKASKLGRNDPCPCGSGLKYKKCHGH
jgi:hypothetical protein